jgi:hypothetical protein
LQVRSGQVNGIVKNHCQATSRPARCQHTVSMV